MQYHLVEVELLDSEECEHAVRDEHRAKPTEVGGRRVGEKLVQAEGRPPVEEAFAEVFFTLVEAGRRVDERAVSEGLLQKLPLGPECLDLQPCARSEREENALEAVAENLLDLAEGGTRWLSCIGEKRLSRGSVAPRRDPAEAETEAISDLQSRVAGNESGGSERGFDNVGEQAARDTLLHAQPLSRHFGVVRGFWKEGRGTERVREDA